MEEKLIHITSGRGPSECAWVVSQLTMYLVKEAQKEGFSSHIISSESGLETGTLLSAQLAISGNNIDKFRKQWEGSILWMGQSMFRKGHRRKNWFIGVQFFDRNKLLDFDESEIQFQAIRSGGPGGQHVNKVSTAIRATHLPTGESVHVSDTRSQFQNKKLAIKRLKAAINLSNEQNKTNNKQLEWNIHNELIRGNPIKTFKGLDFKLIKR